MGRVNPERLMRWYVRSAGLYALGTWTLFCGLAFPFWTEKYRRRALPLSLPFEGEKEKDLDRNAVWITSLTPQGYFVLPKYEWNYVFPKDQRHNAEKPLLATSDGHGPEK